MNQLRCLHFVLVLFCYFVFTNSVQAQTRIDVFTENFDSATPSDLPAGWTTTPVEWPSGVEPAWFTNAGTNNPSGEAAHSAPNVAYFNSYSTSSPKSARLHWTTAFDFTGHSGVALSFWMYHDDGHSGNADRVIVRVSTNGGTSWSDVGAAVSRYDGSTGWAQYSRDLSAYEGNPSVLIGFLAISGFGNDCHIDDVLLSADVVPVELQSFSIE